jgi:putative phage-type endonuclease
MNSIQNQKIIRDLLRQDHEGKYYEETKFKEVVNLVINKINITKDDHEHVCDFLAQYLYFSTKENGYYFNLKRKQTKKKDEYKEFILASLTIIDTLTVNENIFIEIDDKSLNLDDIINKTLSEKIHINQNSDDKMIDFKELVCSNAVSNVKIKEQNINVDEEEINTEEMDELEKIMFGSFNTGNINNDKYVYPIDKEYTVIKRTDTLNGPYGTQWFHDKQVNDTLTPQIEPLCKIYDVLRAVVLPPQRSPLWFATRYEAITASDGGTVLGLNSHEPQFDFIVKKCIGKPFLSNKFCYHGKKLEEPATMVYAYRMNVEVQEFGLMMHKKHKIFGASPDGICSRLKLDKKHISKYVGRMLEIKCPYSRKEWKIPGIANINPNDHKDKMVACPLYYWVQMQLQLECCDLEECDFWQCDIREYTSKEEFITDTDANEPFRSKTFGYEKGCLLQFVPKNRLQDIEDGKYYDVIYDEATFVYPTKIEMSPHDCDMWIKDKMLEISKDPKFFDRVFDKVIYWRIEHTTNITFKRDRVWFSESLPTFTKMWDYVKFFRSNPIQCELFSEYLKSLSIKKNIKVMDVVEKLYNMKDVNYNKFIEDLKIEIKNGNQKKLDNAKKKLDKYNTDNEIFNEYAFTDPDPMTITKKPFISKTKSKPMKHTNQYNDYAFVD